MHSLIADLGSEEVLEHSEVVDLELDDEGLLLVEAQAGEARDGGGFVEHVEVAEGELLGDRLSDLESGLLSLLVALVLAELDRTRTDLALDGEHHIVRAGGDLHGLAQREELLADLGVLVGIDGDDGLVLGLGDSEVLAIDGDQVEVELGSPLALGVLEDDLEMGRVLVGGESDSVGVVSELHDLGKVGDGDTEDHVGVSAVVLKALHGEVEGHESDVGAVHSLERDAYMKWIRKLYYDSL